MQLFEISPSALPSDPLSEPQTQTHRQLVIEIQQGLHDLGYIRDHRWNEDLNQQSYPGRARPWIAYHRSSITYTQNFIMGTSSRVPKFKPDRENHPHRRKLREDFLFDIIQLFYMHFDDIKYPD